MVDILLASLIDAINAHNDLKTGNTEIKEVNETSVRFMAALHSLIDQRINSNIEERRKLKVQEKNRAILISAPSPLAEIDLDDPDYIKAWFKQYRIWYEKRKIALNNGT